MRAIMSAEELRQHQGERKEELAHEKHGMSFSELRWSAAQFLTDPDVRSRQAHSSCSRAIALRRRSDRHQIVGTVGGEISQKLVRMTQTKGHSLISLYLLGGTWDSITPPQMPAAKKMPPCCLTDSQLFSKKETAARCTQNHLLGLKTRSASPGHRPPTHPTTPCSCSRKPTSPDPNPLPGLSAPEQTSERGGQGGEAANASETPGQQGRGQGAGQEDEGKQDASILKKQAMGTTST